MGMDKFFNITVEPQDTGHLDKQGTSHLCPFKTLTLYDVHKVFRIE